MPVLDNLSIEITANTSKATSAIAKLANSLTKLSQIGNVSKTVKNVEQMVKSLGELGESEGIKKAASGIGRLANSLGKLKDATEGVQKMDDIRQKLEGLSDIAKAAPAIKTLSNFQTATRKTSSGVSNFAKKLVSVPWEAFKNKVSGVLKPLDNLFRSFKRIAMYRALRTALKEITQGFATGVKNLYAWAGLVGNSFVGTMDSLATSMNYLRNSLGAMISPLLDALAPAVDILVDKFVDLINLVNQFFATITGATSWRKALKTQKEYADNTDDAAAAQARLNHQLMAFDELNNISVNNPSGRGGGGNNDDVSADDFEEVPLPDWAQGIKDAIDRGDWAGAGSKLAEKLNNLVNNWDAKGFGNRLGEKFESALEFFNSFMEGTDWESIGTKLAGFVTGFLDKIDAEQLGKAITQKFKAIVSTIKGFVWNVDLTKLATALGTAFNEIFSQDFMNDLGMTIAGMFNQVVTFVSTWVDTVSWEEDAKNLVGGLLTAIGNINWSNVGETVGKLAAGISTFINNAISEIIKNPGVLVDAVKDLIGGLFKGVWGEDGSGLLNVVGTAGLVLGLKALFSGALSNSGLVSSLKTNLTSLLASAGFSGGLAGITIACAVGLVWGISEIVDNCKQYGVDRGLWMSLSVADPEMIAKLGLDTTGFVDSFSSAWDWFVGELGVIGPVLKALGIELPDNIPGITKPSNSQSSTNNSLVTGLYEAEKILEKMSKKTYNITINDKNRMLETSTSNAETLVGKTGLGGIKAAYNSKVTTGGLADSKRDAVNYGKALLAVDNKTFSTTVKSSGLTGNTNNSSTYKSNLAWLDKKIATSTFKANGLSTSKTDSTTYKNNAVAVSGKTFSSTFKAPGLSGNKSSVETFKDNAFAVKGQTFSSTFKTTGLESNAGYADDMKSALTAMNGKKYSTTLTTSGVTQAETSTSNITKNLDYATSKPWKIKAEFSYQSSLPPGVLPGVGGMASGGFPPVGSAFIAGEAGPELVGTINGRTGVVSANEISGIGDAIYDTSEAEAALLREQNALLRQLLAKSGNVTLAPNAAAGRWVAQSQAAYARATGG